MIRAAINALLGYTYLHDYILLDYIIWIGLMAIIAHMIHDMRNSPNEYRQKSKPTQGIKIQDDFIITTITKNDHLNE